MWGASCVAILMALIVPTVRPRRNPGSKVRGLACKKEVIFALLLGIAVLASADFAAEADLVVSFADGLLPETEL